MVFLGLRCGKTTTPEYAGLEIDQGRIFLGKVDVTEPPLWTRGRHGVPELCALSPYDHC